MEREYITYAKQALRQLYTLKENKSPLLENLKQFECKILKQSVGRNQYYYYIKDDKNSSYTYLGSDKNPTVQSIKKQRYLSQLLSDVDSEIKTLEDLIKNHTDISYEAINSKLPATYRTRSTGITVSESEQILNWKNAKETEKQKFPQKYPEQLIMNAIDGTPLRSKS